MDLIELQVVCTIREGKLAAFKAVAADLMTAVREQDTKTLRYDWYWNADESVCVIRESYPDMEAVKEHRSHIKEVGKRMRDVAELSFEVYGDPAVDVGPHATPYQRFQGI